MQMMYKVYEWMVSWLDNVQVMLMASLIGTEHHESMDLYLSIRSLVWLVGIHSKLLGGNGFRIVGTDFSWLWNRQHEIIAPPSPFWKKCSEVEYFILNERQIQEHRVTSFEKNSPVI